MNKYGQQKSRKKQLKTVSSIGVILDEELNKNSGCLPRRVSKKYPSTKQEKNLIPRDQKPFESKSQQKQSTDQLANTLSAFRISVAQENTQLCCNYHLLNFIWCQDKYLEVILRTLQNISKKKTKVQSIPLLYFQDSCIYLMKQTCNSQVQILPRSTCNIFCWHAFQKEIFLLRQVINFQLMLFLFIYAFDRLQFFDFALLKNIEVFQDSEWFTRLKIACIQAKQYFSTEIEIIDDLGKIILTRVLALKYFKIILY